MNLPGTEEGNWQWRYAAGALTDERARAAARADERSGTLTRSRASERGAGGGSRTPTPEGSRF